MNKLHFIPILGAPILGATLLLSAVAQADLGFWSQHLVGTWKNPRTGDIYSFSSNAKYTFTPKSSAKKPQSGWWKVVQPTEKESGGSLEGPVAVQLKFKTTGAKNYAMGRLVVNTVEDDERVVDKRYYRINGMRWVRVE